MLKTFLLQLLLIISASTIYAQTKTVTNYQQTWLAFNNQTRLSNKLGLWGDFHLRTKDDYFEDLSTTIARVGLMYYLNDATKLTAGYAYVTHYPVDGSVKINQPEHRPWQQIQWHTKYAKTRMMQWIRLEERYRRKFENPETLSDAYSFNFRLRYNLWYEVPFNKAPTVPSRWSFIVNDEVHINFGKQVVNNYFDQNRFFLGLKFATNAHDNIQVGYMNLFQQLPAISRFRNIDALRLSYFQNLDLRKKKAM
jgi:hypothetical protein